MKKNKILFAIYKPNTRERMFEEGFESSCLASRFREHKGLAWNEGDIRLIAEVNFLNQTKTIF